MHTRLERMLARLRLHTAKHRLQNTNNTSIANAHNDADTDRRVRAPGPARAAVLNTCELVEEILRHLPPCKLFEVQRVSRTWQDIIKHSPLLQKKMFLRPDGAPFRETYNSPKILHLSLNPTASLRVYTSTTTDRKCPGPHHDLGSSIPLIKVHRCPIRNDLLTITLPTSDFILTLKQAQSSWRNMFLTQPPITALDLVAILIAFRREDGHQVVTISGEMHATIYNPAGLKFGNLCDVLITLRKQGLAHPEEAWDPKAFFAAVDSTVLGGDRELGRRIEECDGVKDERGRCKCLRTFLPA